MTAALHRLGSLCALRPWRVVASWIVAAVALLVLGQVLGGSFTNEFRVPGADSQRAVDLAQRHLPEVGATSADIVLHRTEGRITQNSEVIADFVQRVRSQPQVASVADPLLPPTAAGAGGMVSADERTAMTSVQFEVGAGELGRVAVERLEEAAGPLRAEGLQVEFRGLVIDTAAEPETSSAELIGVAAALVVLLLAFGSVVAAGLPIAVALAGLLVGTALVLIAGAGLEIPTAAPIVAVMLGLGAGIDYALFVLTAFRERL